MGRSDSTARRAARAGAVAGLLFAAAVLLGPHRPAPAAPERPAGEVDASALRGKVLCGYQGWFRCPKDAAGQGWIHWSRDPDRITPKTLTFEMWPDLSDFPEKECFPAPGFTRPDGSPARLFSSDHPDTVRRHFDWMREYGIDGVWLQHFVVDLPGGPSEGRYESRRRVLEHVRKSAADTGRVWALAFDVSGTPADRVVPLLTKEWKALVDAKVTADPRYLRQGGRPVVQVWGFYRGQEGNALSAEAGEKLIDFFHAEGPYRAYVVGGGDWDWRRHEDKDWQRMLGRLDAYSPWNVGNVSDDAGVKRASTGGWEEDLKECRRRGIDWLPVVYPGFSWDNLKRKPPGTTNVPRRKGAFLWEQFHALARLKVDSACVAMFDEVDEGTAVFKVTDSPPKEGHFVGLEGMPSDWYLRLVGEGTRVLRGEREATATVPLRP